MNYKDLKNPTEYYRAKPFWSLNGDLDEEEMFRQIECFKKMGFGGAYLHSRSGLETKYMGEKWLSLIENSAKKLTTIGLEAYLYDEDRWPSGTCGGKVTENPEYRLKSLVVEIGKKGDISFFVKFSGNENSWDMISYRKAEGKIKAGETVVGFSVKEQAKEAFYNGNTYVDLMNKKAVEYYFKTTHEKYREKFGDLFGKEIKGIFTDEPHRGCFFNGFGQSSEDAFARFPYTGEIFKRYEELFGEKIEEKLPEVAFRYMSEDFSRAAYRYTETCLNLFINSFFIPYGEFCRKHGLKLTEHLLNEDDLAGQALMCGDLAACYYYMDEPGIDNLGSTATHFSAVKTCVSVASQFGKKRVVSELYGATGWQTSFSGYKSIGDWQAILGINSRCPHLAWYTMKGESKRDYPASISVQSAWWEDYAFVEDYYARFALALSGENLAETLIIHPVESVWGFPRLEGFSSPFRAKSEIFNETERKYREFGEALIYGGVEFDYGSEFLIKTHARVEKRNFILGNKTYKRVVIYGLYTIRQETLDMLEIFSKNGGEVIFGGDYPKFVGGEKYSGKFFGEYFEGNKTEFAAYLKRKQNFPVSSELCEYVIPRVKGKSDFSEYTFALVNTDRSNGKTVKIKLQDGFSATVFYPRTGEIGDNQIMGEFSLDLCKTEESIFFINKDSVTKNTNEDYKQKNKRYETVSLPDSYEYSLSEPNILVLDRALMTVDGNKYEEKELILQDDELRTSSGISPRGRNMFQPWFKKERCEKRTVELEFKFFADYIPDRIALYGENLDKFVFSLNGKGLSEKPYSAKWVDICFDKIEIDGGDLKIGENILTAKCVFDGEPALENFYLSGNFGVCLSGLDCVIEKLPETLKMGDVCSKGLPFYGGKITYFLPLKRGEYDIKIDYRGATAKIGNCEKNEKDQKSIDYKTLSFAPYRTSFIADGKRIPLEITFSRKNVFGPLHRDISDPPSTVPVHFRLTGEHRSEEPSLVENGLIKMYIRRILK